MKLPNLKNLIRMLKTSVPSNMTTIKARRGYLVFDIWHSFNTGHGAFLGRFFGAAQGILIAFLALDRFTPLTFTLWQIILISICTFCFSTLFGAFWKGSRLQHIESCVGLENNQFQRDVHQALIKDENKAEKL